MCFLVRSSAAGPPSLRLLVSSGEPLPVQLLRRLQASLPPHAVVLNLYGSTETAADCTCCNATAWLQGNASAAPCATTPSLPVNERRSAGDSPVHAYPAISSAQGQPPALQPACVEDGGQQVTAPEAAGLPAGSMTAERGIVQVEGRETQQSSKGEAGMRMQTAPVGWPLDNMGVFIAAPIAEAGERGIDGGTPSAACMSAADVLGRGQVGEVCVLGAGLCTGYLRCFAIL